MDTSEVTRARASRAAASAKSNLSKAATTTTTMKTTLSPRNAPYLPTRTEALALALFPTILLFGALFSILSPQTRAAPFDPFTQSHLQDATAPSYFARKSNVFNIYFVKQGWGWNSLAFFLFAFTHPHVAGRRRIQAVARWAAITTWWFLVTQWCFGPPIIDRSFRWTGGACELAEAKVKAETADAGEFFTAVACKAAGGKWSGGHDVSGHVFLLVLGCGFLMQEVGWAAARWTGLEADERSVVMSDGAVKGAGLESTTTVGEGRQADRLRIGGKFAVGVMMLSGWMLLMTAIYFHTWFEKFTGLLTALLGLYAVYIVPRLSSTVRQAIGLPGI